MSSVLKKWRYGEIRKKKKRLSIEKGSFKIQKIRKWSVVKTSYYHSERPQQHPPENRHVAPPRVTTVKIHFHHDKLRSQKLCGQKQKLPQEESASLLNMWWKQKGGKLFTKNAENLSVNINTARRDKHTGRPNHLLGSKYL